MKIAGIVLVVIQVLSFIPAAVMGDNIFGYGLANLIGRCSIGIVGVILLLIAHKRKKRANGKTKKK